MATKRPNSSIHPSRQEQVPVDRSRKRRKVLPPTHTSGVGKSFKKAHTVNDLKSKVRSLRRLLEHSENLPANVRVEKERALQSAQFELEMEQLAKKRSDIIGRYHKVRFFDRQKATKRLKRARKELREANENGSGDVEALQKMVDEAEVDVHYAQYYPLDVAYLSLFPSKRKTDGADGEAAESEGAVTERQGDPVMWQRVKQAMADGTLDILRNGSFAQNAAVETDANRVSAEVKHKKASKVDKEKISSKAKSKDNKQEEGADSADESDGGFFE
ncbi:Hypothetical protein R9X50_00141700 [Acrodontium crateriforme]|uniref:rRNA-processing protein EFG1 n=1 Tax=Acrodontium crateriforme TaxID=150365 RepID=A0AAQ3M0Q6_9PEZI|nr:Hypothetical protein R9X50_00141700 [Acrodontium crateriforme]